MLFALAARQLRARRRQTATVLGGVVLGVAVLVIILSMFTGLLESFTAKILDVAPHVTLKAERLGGLDSDVLVEEAETEGAAVELERSVERQDRPLIRNIMGLTRRVELALGDRITVASPVLSTRALASYGVNELTLPVNGVIPVREARLTGLSRYLISGTIPRMEATRDGMLIGARAAEELKVKAGDRLRLVSLSGEVFNVQIVGVYRMGVEASDRSAYVHLRVAQNLERALPSEGTGIGIHLSDVEDADRAAREITELTGYSAETWQQTNSGFLSIFRFLQMLFRVVAGFVVVICGFGVANVLVTTVLEKQRDIAVMRSYGVSRGAITRLYLLQGLMIATFGAVLGCAVGAAGITLLSRIPFNTEGIGAIDVETLQMSWSPINFAIAVGATLLVSLIAAVAPARSAARVQPVMILRGER